MVDKTGYNESGGIVNLERRECFENIVDNNETLIISLGSCTFISSQFGRISGESRRAHGCKM